MAENQNGAEKTELPTPKRLEDARKEGQVAYSAEISTAVILLVGLCVLAVTGPWFCEAVADSIRYACGPGLAVEFTEEAAVRELIRHHAPLVWWITPLIGALFAVGLAVGVSQVGLMLNGKPLIPKLDRINPVTGFTRLFGLRGWMRLVFGVLKLVALGTIGWLVISGDLAHFARIPHDLRARLGDDAWILFLLGLWVVGALSLIAFGDFLFQRFQHTKDLMMTRQELKEEFKQSEGDPHLKARIRQLQREIAGRRMMQEVPKADVVITNPTHVAVALRYRQDRDQAPVVLAKGYDAVAQQIKAIAAEHRIPMVENVPLARALAKEAKIGRPIPVQWYQDVAQILAAILKAKGAA
jgi:flagellar biosynthetic protein FlhB